jgi:DNA invertase Pin-like site-specific DNA recombinase
MPTAYSYIRMSTQIQLQGDSLRRQLESSESYARANGLTIDTTLSFKDIGFSAYDGSNVEKGGLGKFLHAVDIGKIEKGSYLLVESLDRLSRQKVQTQLRMFLALLEKGINIVTLIDEKIYKPESTDTYELMMSLVIMTRAL